jgi:serine/threonine protein kinase
MMRFRARLRTLMPRAGASERRPLGKSAGGELGEVRVRSGDSLVSYRLGRRIGLGGMAEVFIATRRGAERSGRAVAVKRILPAYSDAPRYQAMFTQEARLTRQLSHPNVVSVLDFGRDEEGRLSLVMEYVDGITLAELAQTGPVPFPVAAYVASEALSGLGYAHALPGPGRVRGMVHRDVSPQNVLLARGGAVKIADFGLAKAIEGASAAASAIVKGKVGYSSPEQLDGQALDARSDLFSLGIVLWELLAARWLFQGSPREIAGQVLFRDIPRPSASRHGIPADLEDVAMRLLERDPRARYQTAEEAKLDLARCRDAPRDGRQELARVFAERFTRARRAGERWQVRSGFRAEDPKRAGGVPPRGATVTIPSDVAPAPVPGGIVANGIDDAPPATTKESPPFIFDEYIERLDALERSPRPGRSRNLALAHLSFHLGLAPEVLSGIDLEQLDLEARTLVDVRVAEDDEPRTVPFNDLVTEALERYVEDRRALVRRADLRPLFLTKRYKRMSVRAVRELVRHHAIEAEIDEPTLRSRVGVGRERPHASVEGNADDIRPLGCVLLASGAR